MKFTQSIQCAVLTGSLLASTGCHIKQPYNRPPVVDAKEFRGATSTTAPATTSDKNSSSTKSEFEASLGETKWWKVFDDPELEKLIRHALEQNFDLKLAAERVAQAQSQLQLARADQRPTLAGSASLNSQQYAKGQMGSNPKPVDVTMGSMGLAAAWNLDFWGKYRAATEAAQAQLLSTEWARRAVVDTVITSVATAYIELRTLDMQRDTAAKTLDSRKQSLALTKVLESAGSDTMLDVREAEQLVYSAEAQITDLDRQIEVAEDTLSTLLGDAPHAIPRGNSVNRQPDAPEIPVGLPSQLLERRPDIAQAEATLQAAHAEVTVARAQWFPQISLTGSAGTNTNALTRLFTGPSYGWNYGPSLSVPIFDAGRIRANERMSESTERAAVVSYQQTVAGAFRDVAKALVAYRRYREEREQQSKVVFAADDALRLARLRYEHGGSSYLEVLTNDRALLAAQMDLTTTKGNELLALVQLYDALGGGWQQ